VHALLRSGMLLSWSRRYDDAIARYDRALAIDPSNTRVRLERGKVLLWSQRYDEAIAAFESVLKKTPDDPWALCGTAQAYAWRGKTAEARPWYERALVADPGMKEARLGLAYLDLEEGDTSHALERARALEAAHPGDAEVAALVETVERARASWVEIGWDHLDDSDDNAMNTYRAEGGFSLPERLDMRIGYSHADLSGPLPPTPRAHAGADALYAVLGWQPKPRHRGELRVGASSLTDDTGEERTTGIGGLSWRFPIRSWTARAAVTRDPFLYSPEILDNEIDVTALTFGAYGMAAPRVQVEANAGYGDFSDGNTRLTADAGAWYVWRFARRSLLLGGVVRGMNFSENLDNGYFDPSNLIAALASMRSTGSIGGSVWTYEATAEAGVQSYTFDGTDTTGKALWNVYGQVARPLPHGLSFQVYAGFGNSSTAAGPGFNSRSVGARLRWTIGG